MGLLQLPTELRLRIYDFLTDLASRPFAPITTDIRSTPAICRTNRQLRHEALPIYAANTRFSIQLNDYPDSTDHPVDLWLRALGPLGLPHVRHLQLSRHWAISQPTRFEGHVGFYVQLSQLDGAWVCVVGTYPQARDSRAMRLASVELLQSIVRQRLQQTLRASGEIIRLAATGVMFVVQAIEIVALHPVTALDVGQSDGTRNRAQALWAKMERQLLALPTHELIS